MAKKDLVTGTNAKFASILSGMTVENKALLEAMSPEDQIAKLEFLSSLQDSAVVADDVVFKDIKPDQAKLEILTAGGLGLTAGTKIRAKLLGTHHVYTKDFKENWTEFKDGTETLYYNLYYKFENIVSGKEFGIWSSPTLRMLEKIPTHAVAPSMVAVNPVVEISYVGKIEGRERLAKEFNIKLSQGNSSHVFIVKVAEGISYDPYVKGCVNSLNSPFPVQRSGQGVISREEATRNNYERIMAAQTNGAGIAGIIAQ